MTLPVINTDRLSPWITKGRFTHSMPCPCRAHAVPPPCRALIHTCHAAPLPCCDSAVSFVEVRVVAGNTRTASLFCSVLLPLFTVVGMDVRGSGMLLITNFVELRVVAGRSRTWAGSPQAVFRRPCCAVALKRTAWSEHGMGAAWQVRIRHGRPVVMKWERHILNHQRHGMAWERHGRSMLCVNRP
jgi:hypothetical protein